MAQDKVAEIIKFTGGAGAPAEAPKREESPPPDGPAADGASGEADAPPLSMSENAGAYLAAAREAAGFSIKDVSDAIKVKTDHIAAIEAMRADLLPALPYATGFVRSYARFLGQDAEAVAARFRAEIAGTNAPAAAPAVYGASSVEGAEGEGARLASVFALMAVLLFVMWVGYQVLSGGGRQASPPQPNITISKPAAPRPSLEGQAVVQAESETSTLIAEPAQSAVPDQAASGREDAARATQTPLPAAPAISAPAEMAPDPQPSAAQRAAPQSDTQAPLPSAAQERPLPRRARAETAPTPVVPAPVVKEAALVRSVAPTYPERCAREAGDVESVTVMFDVNAGGRAVNARIVTSSNDCFNDEALRAMGRWRFSPRTVNGAPSIETGKSATLKFRK